MVFKGGSVFGRHVVKLGRGLQICLIGGTMIKNESWENHGT